RVRALHLSVARHGADDETAALAPDSRQGFDVVDVDQPRRPGQAEVHQRHQALAAREQLALIAMSGQQLERLVLGARVVVLELRGLHEVASSITRCGVRGSCVASRPSASDTALAIAAPAPAVPPSPAPFTPSGFSGDGASSVTSIWASGTSSDVGRR